MTRRDEVIRMADEAGIDYSFGEEMERFAALVAKAERERFLSCYSPDDTATDWADKAHTLFLSA